MKTYLGLHRSGDWEVFVFDAGEGVERQLEPEPLNPRQDLVNHSPDGFAWGYWGSGPAQLALALCADVLKDDAAALELYQDLKTEFVARIPKDENFAFTERQIEDQITRIKTMQAKRGTRVKEILKELKEPGQ